MVYENNSHIFEVVDDDAIKVAQDTYLSYTSLVRDLVGKCTSDIEKARALFRFLTEKYLHHQSWFLYYPEEGNKRGAPTQLLRGVEFGIETKALLFKRYLQFDFTVESIIDVSLLHSKRLSDSHRFYSGRINKNILPCNFLQINTHIFKNLLGFCHFSAHLKKYFPKLIKKGESYFQKKKYSIRISPTRYSSQARR